MKITKFGKELLATAKYYLDQNCVEQKANYVYCGGNPTKFNGIAQGQPYCSAFGSQVIKDTLQRLKRTLHFTLNNNSVEGFYNQAKSYLRINNTPKAGSIAIIKTGITTSKRTSKGDGYSHLMIVRDVSEDQSKFWTIEGNTSSNGVEGVLGILRPSSNFSTKDYFFIHIQDYFEDMKELIDNPYSLFGKNNTGNTGSKKTDILATNLVSVRNEYR